jgi:hypothetical protein
MNAGPQWLDLSVQNNGFNFGTYASVGPLSAGTSSLSWPGILPGVVHYWRVNTWTGSQWVTSATGVFVPCTPALPVAANVQCGRPGTAFVDLYWITSGVGLSQWVDVSGQGTSFFPGTYAGYGPLNPMQSSLRWSDLQVGLPYSFRINTLTPGGWLTSVVGTFMAYCPGYERFNDAPGALIITNDPAVNTNFIDCHTSYTGDCLVPTAPDYDCFGHGDGPYFTGRVNVIGPDVFGLDPDGNAIGCG